MRYLILILLALLMVLTSGIDRVYAWRQRLPWETSHITMVAEGELNGSRN